jgi:hypothetical protein
MNAASPRSTALSPISETIWEIRFVTLRRCMVPGCARRTSGLICGNCTVFGNLITPPFEWMNQYARSKVHPGSYSAIQSVFPKDVGDIVFDYLHQLCKSDRDYVVLIQLKYHAFLYIL